MPLIVEPDGRGPYAHPGPGYDFHERTVSRHLVHRASVSEVFLTGWQATGPYDFLLGAQWPRLHGFYRVPGDRYHDPVLMAETVRQAGLLIGHAGFGVPHGHHFVMDDLGYALGPDGLRGLAVTTEPASLMLDVGCEDVRMRHGRLVSLRVHVEMSRDGRTIGHGSGQLRVITPASYARLRGPGPRYATPLHPPTPAAPELVGRAEPTDVVLSPTLRPDSWLLRTDAGHPVLFDHALDHVPGMLVLEAARQAAQRLRHPEPVLPVELVTSFERYIELDRPCLVRAVREPVPHGRQPDGRRVPVRVLLIQDGLTAADCRLVTEPLGSPLDGPVDGPLDTPLGGTPARRDAQTGRPATPDHGNTGLPLAS
ncbi:ScbA/BarX family gamma-butyrolactone biosynthesis protein [Kitasatospora sp. NPDC097643]|uniref:ScbA/BarX family gamma-butyrolactone biosynthesis protein n=1 Tax=Kitasatospora sp. NPDC097643 TaxID=3157230 RepID=UPI00333172E0